MTFKEFLIHYNIPYEYIDDITLHVKDEDLIKYDKELKKNSQGLNTLGNLIDITIRLIVLLLKINIKKS